MKALKTFLLAAALGLVLPMVAPGPAEACPSKKKVAKEEAPTCDYRYPRKTAKGKKGESTKKPVKRSGKKG